MIRILAAGNVAKDSFLSLEEIRRSGLDGQEIEFVRQVYMDNGFAKRLGSLARDQGLILTVHASYYINLNSGEQEKRDASRKRLLDACERGHHMGARDIVFHAGFYSKQPPEVVYSLMEETISDIQDQVRRNGWDVRISPETTGKPSQFGSLSELLALRKKTGCGICIDFSHLLARDGGIDYRMTIALLPDEFHAHYSGIEWGKNGEKRHIPIIEDDFRQLASELVRQKKDVTLVCEAPDPLGDALKMKRIVSELVK